MSRQTISADLARRIALSAQGFARPRSSVSANRQHLRRVMDHIRLVQLDSVNVAVRAHYMPLFSRLGAYDRALIDNAAWAHSTAKPRLLVECWAHEASLAPIADWPLLRSGAKRLGWVGSYEQLVRDTKPLADDIMAVIAERGPIRAGDIEAVLAGSRSRSRGGWWNRSAVKKICEYLFAVGELTTGARKNFERFYDLTHRVIPASVLNQKIDLAEGSRQLIANAASALGIATASDLRDYYRLPVASTQQAITELVEAGTLEPIAVTGWSAPAYRHHSAAAPRSITGRALLSPFDPLIWERARTERIFGFRYRIEIYVPEPKRIHGYYVFPFLLDGQLVARVDLKADRKIDTLLVKATFAEPGVNRHYVADHLAQEVRHLADWLGLAGIQVYDKGDLAGELTSAVAALRLD